MHYPFLNGQPCLRHMRLCVSHKKLKMIERREILIDLDDASELVSYMLISRHWKWHLSELKEHDMDLCPSEDRRRVLP